MNDDLRLEEKAYDIIGKMAIDITNDTNKYFDYLNVQSNLDIDSVGNSLLVASQFPKAKQVKTEDQWNRLAVDVIDDRYILKLIPDDGGATSYSAIKMYDISQTTSNYKPRINYDNRIKLTALLNAIEKDIKVLDDISGSDKNALWDWNDKILYIKRDPRASVVFRDIACEYAKSKLNVNDPFLEFKGQSISYMICNRYNIDTSCFNNLSVPKEFSKFDQWQIRAELNSMRNVMGDINFQMQEHFKNIALSNKKRDMER